MATAWALATKYATHLPIDVAIAEIARCQHGVISLEQLVILGLSPTAVRSRVARGRLHCVHRGVYAVGHAKLTREGRWMAATLACGEGAVLSHTSAAHLATVTSWSAGIQVTAPGRRGRRRPGLQVFETTGVRRKDLTELDGIPCTTWARTIVDLAATQSRRVVEKAIDRAETLQIFDLRELEDVIESVGPRAGTAVLQEVLREYEPGAGETESEREEDFLELCERHNISRPKCNFWMQIANRWVRHDFWWPDHRVSVEVDGYGTHGTRQGFRSDRQRDRNLILNMDIALLRFDATEVKSAPADVASDVLAILRKRSNEGQ